MVSQTVLLIFKLIINVILNVYIQKCLCTLNLIKLKNLITFFYVLYIYIAYNLLFLTYFIFNSMFFLFCSRRY